MLFPVRMLRQETAMIRHVVIWKLKDFAEGKDRSSNATLIKEALEALPARIPVIRKLEVGINSLHPEANDHVVLVSEFASAADLALYTEHPAHIEVGTFVAKVRSSRVCVDYEF